MNPLQALGNGIYQIPLIPNDRPIRTAAYLIKTSTTVLIECGASPANPVILSALDALGISPGDLDAIIVTHIHLDHAGGAGLLMQQCPNARLLVHPKGKQHLCDPEKLIAGARQVYGEQFETLFQPIHPVPESRVQCVSNGDRLDLGEHRTLHFHEAQGHARHHIIVFDTESRGIFTGDAAGIYHDRIQQRCGFAFSLPNTAPPQFDPVAMTADFDMMISLAPQSLFFTHFGQAPDAVDRLKAAREWIPFFSETCLARYRQNPSLESLTAFIQNELVGFLEREGIGLDAADQSNLEFDAHLNAQGIIAYDQRLQKTAG